MVSPTAVCYDPPVPCPSLALRSTELVYGAVRCAVLSKRMVLQIMYDVVLDDMNNLQSEMLQIGTHFLHNYSERFVADRASLLEDLYGTKTCRPTRYLVLKVCRGTARDLLVLRVCTAVPASEAAFYESLKLLVDIFLECYDHTTDKGSQERIAQTIVDIIARRPRSDPRP
eukprot:739202-Rhodomonas_salina.1